MTLLDEEERTDPKQTRVEETSGVTRLCPSVAVDDPCGHSEVSVKLPSPTEARGIEVSKLSAKKEAMTAEG